MDPEQYRVQFDFEIEFSNGGGLQGQGFRLDIDGADIADDDLAAYIVRDLGLLMVGDVRIRNKEIIRERHKRRSREGTAAAAAAGETRIDLSHTIEHGMITYRGLPAPIVCDFLSHEASRAVYAPGTEFQIGHISLCSNTGTYVDSPFHRYRDGIDLAELPLERLAALDAVVVDVTGGADRAIDRTHLAPYAVAGKAVLVHTGWDRHWRTDRYFEGHPFLTTAAAEHLVAEGALLVGIDSLNIDDTAGGERPVHSTLLAAGIPICEHMTGLGALPASGFRFSAVPVKVKGMGTFPVRAYAVLG
jgi:arylformamidase